MASKRNTFAADLRLLGRRPFPMNRPTKAETDYWEGLFEKAFPGQPIDEILMENAYVKAYIEWLEKAGPEKTLLAEVYQLWFEYLERKKDREKVFMQAWRDTWAEGFARREPLDELHQKAELAGRHAQKEFDYPNEPKPGEDPSLDKLRDRYKYYSYSRVEVRAAVEAELQQIKTGLVELRGIGGEEFNREILPYLFEAIDNFLEAQPSLEGPLKRENNSPVKESTRLLSLIKFAEHARHIFAAFTALQKTISDESVFLKELGYRLNELTRDSAS